MKIVIDTETTGLDPEIDEILQLSILNADDGSILYNQYFKPKRVTSWNAAQAVNGISPKMVENSPCFTDCINEIQKIFSQTKKIIGYNAIFFDLKFLHESGIIFDENVEVIDIMLDFAPIYGEWSEFYNDFKWKNLITCAKYYGYDWQDDKAHNSLADCQATLFCYRQIYKE